MDQLRPRNGHVQFLRAFLILLLRLSASAPRRAAVACLCSLQPDISDAPGRPAFCFDYARYWNRSAFPAEGQSQKRCARGLFVAHYPAPHTMAPLVFVTRGCPIHTTQRSIGYSRKAAVAICCRSYSTMRCGLGCRGLLGLPADGSWFNSPARQTLRGTGSGQHTRWRTGNANRGLVYRRKPDCDSAYRLLHNHC